MEEVVCRPELIDYQQIRRQEPKENLQLAFALAEQEFGITPLLDPEGRLLASFAQVSLGV